MAIISAEHQQYLINNSEFVEVLRKAASGIKHCGDYGHLFYNPDQHAVFLCMGDGDCGGEENNTSSAEEIEQMMLAVDGIKIVIIETEAGPSCDGNWVSIGQIGQEVSTW